MNPSLDTVLQRLPELKVEINARNEIHIITTGRRVPAGPHGLALLERFSQPRTICSVLGELKPGISGSQDWIDLLRTIARLQEAGILVSETSDPANVPASRTGFDTAAIHVSMLNDTARTNSYLAAIRETVRPGDVVVDLGTGTGILAVAAAQAGARRVYAIEAGAIGRMAQAVFAANNVADRITLVPGWSAQVTLPEQADVLVSEIIGNEPLSEEVIETTLDARRRHLKPGARLFPSGIKIFGLPVTIPEERLKKCVFTPAVLREWRSRYGIEFSPLAEWNTRATPVFFTEPNQAREWPALSAPVLLAEINFATLDRAIIDNEVLVEVNAPGEVNGILTCFELELGPTTRLSTHPASASEGSSWRSPVTVLTKPLAVKPGDRLRVKYRHGTESDSRVTVRRA